MSFYIEIYLGRTNIMARFLKTEKSHVLKEIFNFTSRNRHFVPPSPHTMLECMSNIWQSDEILLCFDLMIQAIKTSTNKKHHLSVFLLSPTLYGRKGKQKLLILPQGMRKRRVNALIRSVTMKAWHLYLIHRRCTYNKKQHNFILYKNSPSAFRIFNIDKKRKYHHRRELGQLRNFYENSWKFMKFHEFSKKKTENYLMIKFYEVIQNHKQNIKCPRDKKSYTSRSRTFWKHTFSMNKTSDVSNASS